MRHEPLRQRSDERAFDPILYVCTATSRTIKPNELFATYAFDRFGRRRPSCNPAATLCVLDCGSTAFQMPVILWQSPGFHIRTVCSVGGLEFYDHRLSSAFTASRSALPALNVGNVDAATETASPVRGLPITGRVLPSASALLAKLCRRSWIRTRATGLLGLAGFPGQLAARIGVGGPVRRQLEAGGDRPRRGRIVIRLWRGRRTIRLRDRRRGVSVQLIKYRAQHLISSSMRSAIFWAASRSWSMVQSAA